MVAEWCAIPHPPDRGSTVVTLEPSGTVGRQGWIIVTDDAFQQRISKGKWKTATECFETAGLNPYFLLAEPNTSLANIAIELENVLLKLGLGRRDFKMKVNCDVDDSRLDENEAPTNLTEDMVLLDNLTMNADVVRGQKALQLPEGMLDVVAPRVAAAMLRVGRHCLTFHWSVALHLLTGDHAV